MSSEFLSQEGRRTELVAGSIAMIGASISDEEVDDQMDQLEMEIDEVACRYMLAVTKFLYGLVSGIPIETLEQIHSALLTDTPDYDNPQ